MLDLSANLSTNLSSISHNPRKKERLQKETGLKIAELDSDIKDVIKPLKELIYS